ncbi:MAG: YceI family protein [Flavobacteriales bacterium]|jgi:polyisoprenoid-binding protein YceI
MLPFTWIRGTLCLFFFLSAFLGFSQSREGDSLWTVDNKSKVALKSDDFSGFFTAVKGKMILDKVLNFPKELELVVDVNSLELEIPGMTKHALSSDYFDAAQYPAIKFFGKINRDENGNPFVEGTMVAKGIEQWMKIPLKADALSSGKNWILEVTFPVKRTDFKIGDAESVSNEVNIKGKVYFKIKK